MPLTIANKKHSVIGDVRLVTADVTFDTSYPTGGELGLLALLGLKTASWLKCENVDGLIFEWDNANVKLKALFPTGGGGVTPTTLIAPITATGAIAATLTDAARPNIDPGISAEVGDTADLSTVTTRVAAIGL